MGAAQSCCKSSEIQEKELIIDDIKIVPNIKDTKGYYGRSVAKTDSTTNEENTQAGNDRRVEFDLGPLQFKGGDTFSPLRTDPDMEHWSGLHGLTQEPRATKMIEFVENTILKAFQDKNFTTLRLLGKQMQLLGSHDVMYCLVIYKKMLLQSTFTREILKGVRARSKKLVLHDGGASLDNVIDIRLNISSVSKDKSKVHIFYFETGSMTNRSSATSTLKNSQDMTISDMPFLLENRYSNSSVPGTNPSAQNSGYHLHISEMITRVTPAITELHLAGARFAPHELLEIFTTLLTNNTIEHIDLSLSYFNNEAASVFNDWMKVHHGLKVISLAACELKFNILKVLTEGISLQTKLRYLDISGNRITKEALNEFFREVDYTLGDLTELHMKSLKISSLPTELFTNYNGLVSNLTKLSFAGNALVQEAHVGDLNKLLMCRNLIELDFSGNKMRGTTMSQALGRLVFKHPTLRIILYNGCGIDASAFVLMFGSGSGTDKSRVKSLSLANNSIKEVEEPVFETLLKRMPALEALDLSGNLIDNSTTESLTSGLKSISVKELKLMKNKIGDRGLEVFSSYLMETRSLKELNCLYNDFRSEGVTHFATALEKNSSLERLAIGGQTYSRDAISALANALTKKKKMIGLTLRQVRFPLPLVSLLCEGLPAFSKLSQLDIEACEIDSEGILKLTTALQKSKSVKEINFSRNPIGLDGARCLAVFLTEAKSLEKLNLSECNIPEEGLRMVRAAMEESADIKYINLRRNGPNIPTFTIPVQKAMRKLH